MPEGGGAGAREQEKATERPQRSSFATGQVDGKPSQGKGALSELGVGTHQYLVLSSHLT